MSRIAIIPARGGSKRIPDKNIRLFAGHPIISYPINCALQSGLFDRVIVSTDSEKIAKVAIEAGAEVPFMRSAANATDQAPLAPSVIEVLRRLAIQDQQFDQVCCLLATAALIRPAMLKAALDKLSNGPYDSVFSVQKYSYPILRSLELDDQGYLGMIWKEHLRTRSQDLKPAWHDAGQFYWATTESLINQQTFFSIRAGGYELRPLEAHDIDTPEDWQLAEQLYAFREMQEAAKI